MTSSPHFDAVQVERVWVAGGEVRVAPLMGDHRSVRKLPNGGSPSSGNGSCRQPPFDH